jgi:hypothetical protein
MKLLTKILLLSGLAVVFLQPVAPAQAGKKMEVQLQDDGIFLFPNDYYDRDVAFRQARALGVTGLRMNIQWFMAMPAAQAQSTVKPSQVNYQFGVWDNAIARARQYGMRVQLALAGDPPAWACGDFRQPYACDGYRPNVAEFRAFAQAVAAHFGGSVARYSIWNEPNWYTWISPHNQSPLIYRELYQAGYEGVKAGYPKAKVLMGELAPRFQENIAIAPLEFLRKMVCVNAKFKRKRSADRKCGPEPLKLDGFAHHPYHFEVRPGKRSPVADDLTMANIDDLNVHLEKLTKLGVLDPSTKKIKVYLTEHGYMVTGNPDVRPRRQIPEYKRKKWVVNAFDIAQRTRRIKGMLYYNLVSAPLGSPSSYFDLGLIQTNGVPRESYWALRNWAQTAIVEGRVKPVPPCSGVVC